MSVIIKDCGGIYELCLSAIMIVDDRHILNTYLLDLSGHVNMGDSDFI